MKGKDDENRESQVSLKTPFQVILELLKTKSSCIEQVLARLGILFRSEKMQGANTSSCICAIVQLTIYRPGR